MIGAASTDNFMEQRRMERADTFVCPNPELSFEAEHD